MTHFPENELRVYAGPILREALASVQPGEDFDEALLRTLKIRYPHQARELLTAVTKLVEFHAEQSKETPHQVMQRLSQEEPGPEIVFKSSMHGTPCMRTESRIITVNGKEYNSLDDVPPEIRHAIQNTMSGERRTPRVKTGCTWMLLGGWLIMLLRGK